jgi:hypothetical protein
MAAASSTPLSSRTHSSSSRPYRGGGLAMLAKETTVEALVRRALRQSDGVRATDDTAARLARDDEGRKRDLSGLKERTDACAGTASYRSDADTVPLTDSIGTLPMPTAPVSGLETANRAGVNVLVDDYWDLYQSLLQ